MRSACRINLLLFLLGAAVASAQINPATQIRWPNNCVGGNLYYDIVHNTCTAGSVNVTIGVNGQPVASPNFSDTTPSAPFPNQNVHFQTTGNNISAYVAPSSSGGSSTCYADQQAGSTWDAKVQACLNSVYSSGGGTVDARGLTGAQTLAKSVTVGNASVSTVLLMGPMTLTRAAGTQILVNTYGQLIGAGSKVTIISGETLEPAVQQAYGPIKATHWEHFSVQGTGSVTSGVPGVQFGGPNPGIPYPNWTGAATNGYIGKNSTTDAYPWPGYITQVAVYNHALTAAQVHNHYVVGTTGTGYEATVTADNPIAYYPLKETSGTTATDVIAGHNGTYSGGFSLASINGVPGDTSCGGICKMPLFDGSTGYVLLPTSFNWISNADWTIEGWYQPNVPDGNWKRLWSFDAVELTQNSNNDGLQIDGYGGHVSNAQIGFNPGTLYHVVIVHISSPSAGLLIYVNGNAPRVGSDVSESVMDDVGSSGFDIGLQLKSEGGCICYNQLSNLNVAGNTYGLDTENVSGYPFGVNSNTFINGKYGGPTGIRTNGGTVNTFIKPDMEGNSRASYELDDYDVYMISPYEESSGAPIINGANNYITGFGAAYSGTCTTCIYVSPGWMPNYWSVQTAYLFGSSGNPDSGSGTTAGFFGPTGSPFVGVDLKQMGNSVNTYGFYGHAPLRVGPFQYFGGLSSTGASYLSAIGPVAAPTAVVTGGGTGTSYTYYVVAYDKTGGVTLPSPPVTVSGPATLNSTNYITVTPPQNMDGVWCWDVLKGDTSHILTVDGTNHCSNAGSTHGNADKGQATVVWTPPTRDTTGDFSIQGYLSAGSFGISGCAPGTYLKADFSGCATPPGAAGIANTSLTVGTTAIATCTAANTIAMTGLTTGMTITITPTTDVSPVTGWGPGSNGGLYFTAWPTANTVNYKVCNATTSSITPSASTTWNVSVR